MMVKFLSALGIVFSTLGFALPVANVDIGAHAKVSFLAEKEVISPGQSVRIAFFFELDPGWHIYWINPGDSGLAPKLTLKAPAGSAVKKLSFPPPDKIPFNSLMNYGYTGSALFWTDYEAPTTLKEGDDVFLEATIKYLICNQECLPATSNTSIKIPVVSLNQFFASPQGEHSTLFARVDVQEAMYVRGSKVPSYQVSTKTDEDGEGYFEIEMLKNRKTKNVGPHEVYFFPVQNVGTNYASAQIATIKKDRVLLKWPQSETKRLGKVQGLLQIRDRYYDIDLVLDNSIESEANTIDQIQLISASALPGSLSGSVKESAPSMLMDEMPMPTPTEIQSERNISILLIMFFAFFGGLILNVMPCIFPVLSLKILAFANQSDEQRSETRKQGWWFSFGVLVSFLVLGLALISFRTAGQSLGWGFQLQSPAFVLCLILVFFLMGLSLLGAFEVGASWMGFGGGTTPGSGVKGALLTGVLSVVAATPCSAPFMSTALGFALSASTGILLSVCLAMGVGLSFPYLLASYWSGLHRVLPKPGRWLENLKHIFAFPLFGTVIWLFSVLMALSPENGVMAGLLSCLIAYLAIWIYEKNASTFFAKIIRISSVIICVYLIYNFASNLKPTDAALVSQDNISRSSIKGFKQFSKQAVNEAVSQGKWVLIDFTAKWCVTCIVNERLVFENQEIQKLLENQNIAAFAADWTQSDPIITEELRKFGRNSVPLYVLFNPVTGKTEILPQILTVEMLRKKITLQ